MKKFYFLLMVALLLFSEVNAQIITIPDANFKAKLLAASPSNTIAQNPTGVNIKIDTNNNNEIEVSEALSVSRLRIENSSISDLTGINSFSELRYLWCESNQLTSLDVSGILYLRYLYCDHNQLSSLNVTGLNWLTHLNCDYNLFTTLNLSGLGLIRLHTLNCNNNLITTLNVSGLTVLGNLNCSNNQLSGLDFSGLSSIYRIDCNENFISSIDVSNLLNLNHLNCWGNQISILDVTALVNLQVLICGDNLLSSIDVSNLINIEWLICGNTNITTLDASNLGLLDHLNFDNCPLLTTAFLKNGSTDPYMSFTGCPNLEYICTDAIQVNAVNDLVSSYNYTNCVVNSYCSFTPGGTFYSIQGNTKYDANGNGCDASDTGFPNLQFNITDGTNNGSLTSDTLGNYLIPVVTGIHTVTPVFENPAYFNVSPTNVIVDFPTQASPFTQNFCVTANGVHPDLEVIIVPMVPARPGFDAVYKIIYKNKGTTTQSGTVNFVFSPALNFVSANPVISIQVLNNLEWGFVNLQPLETREITVVLHVNSPSDTPEVNIGDILNFISYITSPATDETPGDNTFTFDQTVVGSYDPNDKTCLEGGTISPAKVGDYVHYMIRFENTGTFPAENIVVKDLIDLTKFDISTLVPMKGSHSFVTNITSGNKVEFIFENINLPFDDANNDGYVAFKIKTQPTLILGDTFSNTASIYFDYNFPIVTNTATTTIAVLATQDFVFSNYFSVYPNPVKDILNITAKETIEVTSINIYNTLGQLVLVIPNAQNTQTVDISGLTAGNYFIKINSDKGTSNTKFIKN
ncbi:MAG: T9SS type A sorting domain-containing protein [Flavobacterium sp.]